MTYRTLYWSDEEGRLKNFSASTKDGVRSIVKIEIEVLDPYLLASMLRELATIKRDQGKEKPTSKAKTKLTAHDRTIANERQLLLTHRKE